MERKERREEKRRHEWKMWIKKNGSIEKWRRRKRRKRRKREKGKKRKKD